MKRIWRVFRRLQPYLSAEQRRFMWFFIVASTVLSILDVVAIGLLSLALATVVRNAPLHVPLIGDIQGDDFVWVFFLICVLIIGKAILNVGLQWLATRQFAGYELRYGDALFDAYIKAPWIERISRNTSELVRMADVGISVITSGFLLPVMTIPSLLATFVAVFAVIIVAQPVTAGIALVYFALVGLILYRWISSRAIAAGRRNREYSQYTARLMTEMVHALKEVTLRNKGAEVAKQVHARRMVSTDARARAYFLGAVPRFILDGALIGGFLIVGVATFAIGGFPQAVTAVSVFAVAGFRILPTIVSFQGIVTNAQANITQITPVLHDIDASREYVARAEQLSNTPLPEEPRLFALEGVGFTYPGAKRPALKDISVDIPIGSTLGIVGPTGAGKSTLIDILLGLLEPSEGRILIDGRPLTSVLSGWRSRVGYVPQQVALFNASIAQNIALTWGEDIDEDRVRRALERAHLWEIVEKRDGGMHSVIGEQGIMLSGGQRQRLGIARALYTEPLVVVLDEATSSLDTKTEADVSRSIRELRGETTLISVAHRLSTVRDYDMLCYVHDGEIVARGSFDELVAAVPEFAMQASLAGLA
ncbi:ABC transporter ATP-binding protein [Gryllotalpicola daejeonensis]|uniref:ABC transporter ATP-binding protein n=1 Tax=Gryllotalpicola daejeonensis TaxID=993087 RepID=A0ABP7ZNA1_9MICO